MNTMHPLDLDLHPFHWSGVNVGVVTLAQESAPPIKGQSDGGQAQQPQPGQSGQPVGPSGQGQGGQPPPPAGGGQLILLFALVIGFMFVFQLFSARKEKKKRQEMLSSLARHDRVQTVGGMIGTISDIRDDEVVLKIDEATNTKARFSRASVQQVLKKAGGVEHADQPAAQQQEPEKVNA